MMPLEREISTLKQYCFQYLLRNHEKIPSKKVSQIYEISDIREEFISMAKKKNLVDDQFFSIFGEIFIISNLYHNLQNNNNNNNNNNSNTNSHDSHNTEDDMDLDTTSSVSTNTSLISDINNTTNNNNNINNTIINNNNNNNNNSDNNNINNNNNNNSNNNNEIIPQLTTNTTIDLTNIQKINLSGLARLTDISIQYISGYKHLQELDLSFCTGVSNEFVKHLSKIPLVSLNLFNVTSVNDNTLQLIATSYPNLKRLLIGGCGNITEQGIKSLLKCTLLQELDVSHCKKLTNSALKLISFPCLTYLNASWCFDLTSGDNCFNKIAKQCTKLTTLRIAASAINEQQLIKVLSEAKKLTSLDISFCPNAIANVDSKLFKYMSAIQNLHIAGCSFKEPILRKIIDSTPHLKDLDISHQDGLPWSFIESIIKDQSTLSHLKTLNFSLSKFDKFDSDALLNIHSLTVFFPIM
ncbi:hypothetical protein ACTFIV_004253 [Dictyostelium citrinum]